MQFLSILTRMCSLSVIQEVLIVVEIFKYRWLDWVGWVEDISLQSSEASEDKLSTTLYSWQTTTGWIKQGSQSAIIMSTKIFRHNFSQSIFFVN